MPAIPTPVLEITAVCNTIRGQFVNISFWQPVTPPTSISDLATISDDFGTQVGPLYAAVLNSGGGFIGNLAKWLDGTNSWTAGSATGAAVGTLGGTPVSDQNAVVIRKTTGLVGNQNRGRFFIGGMDSSAFKVTAPDELDNALFGAYGALATFYGGDRTFNGVLTHSRHWDRKDNLLRPIMLCSLSSRIASRDDRRRHASNHSI